MRVAIIISGQPRFQKADFESHFTQFKGADRIDWFFYLWQNNEKIINIPSNWWNIPDANWAAEKINSVLPKNHVLARLVLGNYDLEKYKTLPGIGSIEATKLQWHGVKQVDLLRQDIQKKWGHYDLVIRSRVDRAIAKEVCLQEIKKELDFVPNLVYTPNHSRHYCQGYGMCDTFAITTPENMSIYSDLINYIDEYCPSILPAHPEALLHYHLTKNRLILRESLEMTYSTDYSIWY